ncbi:hypothetical protein PPYR_02652 [Photinus pyralis]|uniref:DUF8207 domain-containing protein n=1 Tax=Photinus pyralis TaxID=7054 RepID=A0A5N4B7W8_PHOPY|nr:hypothetical protein PPYR_02652 [Photinus pyralis]
MNARDKTIKQKLTKTRNAIKRKLEVLKRGELETQRLVEATYKPIVEPLKKIAKQEPKIRNMIPKVEHKIEYESTPIQEEEQFRTPQRSENGPITAAAKRLNFIETDEISNIAYDNGKEGEDEDTTETINLSQLLDTEDAAQQFLNQYHVLPRQYIERMIKDTKGDIDHFYGLRYDANFDQWAIGDSKVTFDGPNLIIKDKIYNGTPGLYELLVLKKPQEFSSKDGRVYKEILDVTNGYRRNYDPGHQIVGTKSHKYRNILKPLLSEHYGTGMKEVNNTVKEYVYWNTPHELVERLRLLHASRVAGHTGHNNEISSIEEELREEGIIV